ncbi:MAG: VWA domain-containing protein [Elusimicrobia bacterium]|nr:VWA domain-containing protein [Elusimicrobiota bacterium]
MAPRTLGLVVALAISLAALMVACLPEPDQKKAAAVAAATGVSAVPAAAPLEADAPEPAPPPVSRVSLSSSELPSGGFMAVREGVKLGPFVLEHTEVKAEVSGGFARVEVSQLYSNPHKERIEAIYTFPLPENAAVTDMFMRISSRVVTSEVHEREQAKKIYESAKASGHVAALLEQERPNIFTQSVANIPPGEKVFVQVKYVHELAYDAGRYRFVFPMVVGPRYIPGSPTGGKDKGQGWSPDTDRVPDASRITPHPLLPGERSGHDIAVSLELAPGLPIEGLHSISHEIKVDRPAPGRTRVRLSPNDVIPNKDLTVEWGLRARKPEIAVVSHRVKDDGYLMMLIQPQASFKASEIQPKEMVFVVDTSGSQSGEPLAKEKQLVRRALKDMNPRDTFRVIRFDDNPEVFSPNALPGTPDNIRSALSWVNALNTRGGTELLKGMRAALDPPREPGRRRMVFFLTDGYIGNETEVLAAIEQRLGDARIFSFGVGSSVNRYLLESMAKVGRGFAQFVRNDQNGDKAVELFYRRVRNPLLLDLKLDWGGLPVTDLYPETLPDLFDAQPLYVFARYSGPSSGTIRLTGTIAGRKYEARLAVPLPKERKANSVLAPLWARRRIEGLMARQFSGDKSDIVEQVKTLGLKYKLMTRYTSFVAVERTLREGMNVPLQTVLIPTEMPEGVSFEGTFGKENAVVSIPRMKPGDPVLMIAAPQGTAAVIADFPFGRRQLCAYDPGRERWACRFLVPRSVPDGKYLIRILCVGSDGSRTAMEASYTVDSKAPVLEIAAKRVGSEVELTVRPKAFVLEQRSGPRGAMTIVHDIKRLRVRAPGGQLVAFKLEDRPGEFIWKAKVAGRGTAIVEAVDFAGNISLERVALP